MPVSKRERTGEFYLSPLRRLAHGGIYAAASENTDFQSIALIKPGE
jgi:hypothetical protein